MKNQFKILCGTMALAMTGQVFAATDWLLTSATVVSGAYVVGTLKATAWADTGDETTRTLQQQMATSSDTTTNFKNYGAGYGLGINNKDFCGTGNCDAGELVNDAPEHAIDNDQRFEMVLLDFGSSQVKLTAANFGWIGSDGDFTIMAYQGSGNPNLASSKTWAGLGGDSAWVKVGNFSTPVADDFTDITKPNSIYSSYWLIGAYNPLAGGTSTDSNIGTGSSDALKLAAVRGDVCVGGSGANCTPPGRVPEPGSLALFGIALLGMLTLRKLQQA